MENYDNTTKPKNKKERCSNTSISTNESPFLTPVASPMIDCNNKLSNNEKNDDKFNNYNLCENKKKVNLDSLVLNLKIISKIKPGYKISLKENNTTINDIYIDNSYFQNLYRIFSDNSRENTINFLDILDKEINTKIEELVKDDNFNHTNMFLNSKENILLNLSHNLNLSLVGLNNLINTYDGDEYTISKIEMIINNFELKIRKISYILKVNK
jgi:hypothetical protein